MRATSRPSWAVRSFRVAAAVVLSLSAIAVAALAIPLADYRATSSQAPAGALTAVVLRTTDIPSAASLAVRWDDGQTAVVRAAGLVTAVFAADGERIECGDRVVEIDGAPLVAYCAPRPLWREVGGSTVGADAEEVAEFLRASGDLDGSGSPEPAALTSAIRSFQRGAGQAVTGTIAPGDMVWIGSPVEPTVDIHVGDSVIDGDLALRVPPAVVSARLDPARPADGVDDSVFTLDDSDVPFDLDDGGNVVDVAALSAEVAAISSFEGDPPPVLTGSIRLAQPREVASLPATSIVSGSSGVCVHIVADDGGAEPVAVEVVGSSVGIVLVTGPLTPGSQVTSAPDRSIGC